MNRKRVHFSMNFETKCRHLGKTFRHVGDTMGLAITPTVRELQAHLVAHARDIQRRRRQRYAMIAAALLLATTATIGWILL
jgi:hypothetical protein